jgi:gliding motility-associated-like protein
MNRLRTILLTILLAVAYGAAGQGYVIDSVCQGAERHYRIDGEAGSTYTWTLTDLQGTVTTLPETADTVTIIWNMLAGNYTLSTLQTSIHGCDSLELGTIKIFENPEINGLQAFTSTNGLANGYVIVNAGGVASQFTYSLDEINWQNSNVFPKLSAGSYTVWVRNNNGCMVSQQFTIKNTVTGNVKVLAGSAVSCISLPFDIPVRANDFTSISDFTVQLAFDPSIMTFNKISQINNLLNNGILSATMVSSGVLQISFTSSDSLTLQSQDQLFTLEFIGTAPGACDLKWNLTNCVIYSASGYELPAIYTQGHAEVKAVPQIYIAGNGGYCENTPHKLSAGSLTGQSLNYKWTSPDGTTQMGQELDLGLLGMGASGTYKVDASDGVACAATETLDLQVYPNPQIHLNDYDTLCAEQEILLNPGIGFASYQWQDGSTDPQLLATKEGIYWVVVTDNNGCQASDSVLLRQCELLIYMPNIFTPNGDGINDVFQARYNPDVAITYQMYVFNKWGEEIFNTNDVTKGWDGTYKGEMCPQDTYTWMIQFSAPGNYKFLQKSPQRGIVMLLK